MEKEGISLEYDKVKPNPGLKATAKLMLNSFWGKFGQRENLPQVQQCTNPDHLYKILEDDTLEVQNIRFCTDDVLEVVYVSKEEAVVPSNKTNVFVAAFTTCHARLKLYSYLEKLNQQVLYYDALFARATKSNLEPRRRRSRCTLEMIKTLRKEEWRESSL